MPHKKTRAVFKVQWIQNIIYIPLVDMMVYIWYLDFSKFSELVKEKKNMKKSMKKHRPEAYYFFHLI